MDDFKEQFENAVQSNSAEVMSIKDWLITMIILAIPIVGLVMIFVWAFGSNTNPNKANYCKATLIMAVIGILLYVLFGAAIVGTLMMSQY